MSLGQKIVTLFLILGISFSLGSFVVLKLTVFPAFNEFENDAIDASSTRVRQALTEDLIRLKAASVGYAKRDSVFDYVTRSNPVASPWLIRPIELERNDVDLLVLLDAKGQVALEVVDGEFEKLIRATGEQEVSSLFTPDMLMAGSRTINGLAGYIRTRYGVLQFAQHPVVRASNADSVAGRLVLGRRLTAERIARIGERTSTNLALDADFSPAVTGFERPNVTTDAAAKASFDTPTHAPGRYDVFDINGNNIARFAIQAPQQIARVSAELTRTITLLLIALTVVFLVTSSLFIRRYITEPVRKLTEKILSIRESGTLEFEAEVKSSDEVGVLAREFAVMTAELNTGKVELERARDDALAISSAKSDFIARISHEIRTPMSGVLGMTELLKRTPLSDKQIKFTDTILDSAKTLLDVINNVLDFSKIEAGELQLDLVEVQLNQLVEEVVESHAAHAHAQATELMAVLPRDTGRVVKTDALRLKQILNNLISNAIKFTRGGEVVVRLSTFESEGNVQNVYFEITDSGIGIDPEQQEAIFETFKQAEGSTARLYGGSGLGLTICKQLIEQMGGQLQVRSTPSEGSVFSFTLPLETESAASLKLSDRSAVAGARVLVVDDSTTHRGILEHQLQDWKVAARTAASLDDAYAQLVSAMTHGTPFDLVLIDLAMPNRSGLDLVRTIRANPRFELLKIIVLSSLAQPVPPDLMSDFDVAGELCKPVRQSQLHYAIRAVMRHQTVVACSDVQLDDDARRLRGHVLVVEDNDVNREVALRMLESMGLETEYAVNGLEAVERLSSHQFDLVLMDCQLPVMDGLKATETIRQQERELGRLRVPIVAATANAFEADYELCLRSGMDECIAKPFTINQLFAVLSRYLASAPDVAHHDSALPSSEGSREESGPSRVIDESILGRLSQLQQPGAPNIVRKLLSLYLQSSSVIKDRLGNAIDSSDDAVVRESAHALKSSSLNVGAMELADLCKRLELMSRNGGISDATELRRSLEKEYGRVVTAVKSELGHSIV